MKQIFIVVALVASLSGAPGTSAAADSAAPLLRQFEEYGLACDNFIATLNLGYAKDSSVYSYFRKACIESASGDPEFVTEWLPKQRDELSKALSKCRMRIANLRTCLALELKRIERNQP